jgi:hypothetical protein
VEKTAVALDQNTATIVSAFRKAAELELTVILL